LGDGINSMSLLSIYSCLDLTFYFFLALPNVLQINKGQTTMVANRNNQNNNKEITMTGNISPGLKHNEGSSTLVSHVGGPTYINKQ